MAEILSYKEYNGSVEVSIEDGVMHGEVLFVRDLITYEGVTVSELEKAFQEAVDNYLAHCKEVGKEPDKPCSGTFNVRLGSELHKEASLYAKRKDLSLNELMKKAVEQVVKPQASELRVVFTHNHNIVSQEHRASTTINLPRHKEVAKWTSNVHSSPHH